MTTELLLLTLWVLAQLALGLWVARRVRTEDDFFVAGRRLGPWMAAASVFATWFGAESCVGAAGQVHESGLGALSVEPYAYGLCLLVMGLVFAVPLWRLGITTLPDFFARRFGTATERVAALVLMPASILWAAAQIRAFGTVLAGAAPSLDVGTGIAIAAVLAGLYTMLGGLLADVVTDLLQGGVLIVGLVLLLVAVTGDLGGASGLLDAAGERLAARAVEPSPGVLDVVEAWAIPICGSVVAQEVVSRSLAARSAGTARGAALGGGGIYLLVGTIPVVLGLVGGRLVPGLEDGEQLLPTLAREYLPMGLFVLFSGALVAAILSTVDSALLVVGSLVERNLLLGRTASDALRLRVARGAVLAAAGAAWWLAAGSDGVFALVELASAFGSSGVLVCVVLGLFTRRGGQVSALAALGTGAALWVLGDAGGHWPHPYLVSLGGALVAYLALSGLGAAERPVLGKVEA